MIRSTTSWLLLIAASILFGIAACIVDCLIKLLHRLGKKRASRRCFLGLSQFSEMLLKLWGTRVEVDAPVMSLDPHRPILFVSSHHSSLDACLLGNHLAQFIGHRKLGFVCRGGLDRWIPSFSFYARQYCYSLTKKGELSDSSPSITTVEHGLPEYAKRMDAQGDALIFYPEGVKPLDELEHCRSFRRKGLRILLKNMPNVQIVPIGIAGTRSFFTTPRCLKTMLHQRPSFNCCLQIQILPALPFSQSDDVEKVIDLLEEQISSSYETLRIRMHARRNPITLSQKWTL